MSIAEAMVKEHVDKLILELDQMKWKDNTLTTARSLIRTEHYICPEDAWYSCPESGASLNHHVKKCDCGFDAYNAKMNQIIEYIQST